MKVLLVIDMQHDFVDGTLGSQEALAIVNPLKERILKAKAENNLVIYTKDTHYDNYLDSQEGLKLPVKHCIKGTFGWEILPNLLIKNAVIFEKESFGSLELANYLSKLNEKEKIEEIVLTGLCTDICVISNAMILKAALQETPIKVDASLCAGVTPQSHIQALGAMQMCQIEIINNK